MARYRVEFSREWVLGRWGFIDHLFHRLGGKETEPSRLENAWLVEYKGKPSQLGKLLSDLLEIKRSHFADFGAIFEIREVPAPAGKSRKGPADGRSPKRLDAPIH